jgi:hypothetical protein
MPLIDENTRKCPFCLTEYKIRDDEWELSESDPYIFKAPLCPECKSGEAFCWHDEVYKTRVSQEMPLPPEVEGGPDRVYVAEWVHPNPEHPRAKQMVLIAAVAKKLGVKQKKLDTTPETFVYAETPKKPTKKEAREWIETVVAPTDTIIRDAEVAEVEYHETAFHAHEGMLERTKEKSEIREEKNRSSYEGETVQPQPLQEVLEPPATDFEPVVDEKEVKKRTWPTKKEEVE